MEKAYGYPHSKVWLVGDSNPENWDKDLRYPFDPRHPVRHNILTPILEVVQENVFRADKSRIDTGQFYIRNAVEDASDKPDPLDIGKNWYGKQLGEKLKEFRESLADKNPILLMSFGAFAFEFCRRALGQNPERNYGYWDTKKLGIEFKQRIEKFDPDRINLLPLLHVSIARGKFLTSHKNFCGKEGGNYFEFVGQHLAAIFLKYKNRFSFWI
jgi:hypothetical protein